MTSRDCRLSCSPSKSVFKFETTMYMQDFVEHYDTGGKYDIGKNSILGNLRMQLLGNTHNASEYNSQIPNLNVQLHSTSTSGKANELFKWRGLPGLYPALSPALCLWFQFFVVHCQLSIFLRHTGTGPLKEQLNPDMFERCSSLILVLLFNGRQSLSLLPSPSKHSKI